MESRSPKAKHAGPAPNDPAGADEASSARRTLIRVIVVQAVALWLLWLLQAAYHV